jgi:crotonobetainyl-CoA:carnitine CoA-transferase CaiB-like acyl-CoA transferase
MNKIDRVEGAGQQTEKLAPLAGIKVLDLSRVLAGPSAGQALADLGADVIKVENPGLGDDTRGWGIRVGENDSTYYYAVNRSKRSIALDLNTKEGQALAIEMATKCDVLIENFKTGGMEKFGLDYESLSAKNPRLVYCSVSGYGRTGALKHRLGYDLVVQAEAGLMYTNGRNDDEPLKVGVAVVDLFTGMYTGQAILAALHARERTGRGQFVDIALFDCGLALLSYLGSSAMYSGNNPYRYGNNHPDIVPYGLFMAADGPLIITVGNDNQFHKLARDVLERPDIANDERFKVNMGRMKNRPALMELLTAALATKKRDDLLARMEKFGIPGGSVRTVTEALSSPEAAERRMTSRVPHPDVGEIPMLHSPIRLSDTPVRDPARPPQLGEHTDEILRTFLGKDPETIESLREQRIIR